MNKKNKDKVKGRILNIRLTEIEDKMAHELRNEYNVNISSLIRNAIRSEYGKVKRSE